MTRIDAHQHYWKPSRGDYGWLTPDSVLLYRDYLPDDLVPLLAAHSISGTVLVQAAPTEEETLFLFEIARAHPSVLGVIGWIDFESKGSGARIPTLIDKGGGILKGLRPMVQDIADAEWLGRPALDEPFEALESAGLVFDALVRPQHLAVLEERLLRHPQLNCVIDHGAKPRIGAAAGEEWASLMQRLARLRSVYCKLSGLLTECTGPATLEAIEPFVAHLFHCFGPERIVWGSDWPVITLRSSYAEWLDMARRLVARHAPGAEEAIFSGNARRIYNLTPRNQVQ